MLRIHIAALVSSADALAFPPLLSEAGGIIEHQRSLLSPEMQQMSDAVADQTKAHWPSLAASRFSERIDAAIAAAKTDPCNAEMLSNGLSQRWGLGARANDAANELQVAAYFNKSIALCDGSLGRDGMSNEGINYEGLFTSSFGMCKDLKVCLKKTSQAWSLGHTMTESIRQLDYGSAAHMLSASYQALFGTLNAETQVQIDAAHQQAGLQTGSAYVGVHIRRGDKADELKSANLRFNTTEEYAGIVESQLMKLGLDTVYLASDDAAVQAELLSFLRPSIPTVKVIQCFTPTSASRHYGDSQETYSFLADVAALRDAVVFIGTQSSRTGSLIRFLRPDNSISISTDGDWLENAR